MGSLSWPRAAAVISPQQLSRFHPGSQVSFFGTDELRSSIAAVHGLGGDADSTWDNEGDIYGGGTSYHLKYPVPE